MGLLDVAATARYGLVANYFDDLFNSRIRLGRARFGVYTVPRNQGQGRHTFHEGDAYVDRNATLSLSPYPYRYRGSDWLGSSWPTKSRVYALVNLAGSSQFNVAYLNPDLSGINRTDIARANNSYLINGSPYAIFLSSGARNRSYTQGNRDQWEGKDFSLSFGDFNAENITFTPREGSELRWGLGSTVYTGDQIASGPAASATFQLLPGASPTFSLRYSYRDSAEVSTRNGTLNRSNTRQRASVTIGTSFSASLTYGVMDLGGVEVGVRTEATAGYARTWENASEINFSETTSTVTAEEDRFQQTVDLSNLVFDDDGVSRNGDLVFQAGATYRAMIRFVRTTSQQTVSGDIVIGGTVGSINDGEYNNSIARAAADALSYGHNRQGPQVLGYDPAGLGTLSSNRQEIGFTGEAVARTSASVRGTLMYAQVVSQGSALVSSPETSSLALQAPGSAVVDNGLALYDLEQADTAKKDSFGVYMEMEAADGDQMSVMGTGREDVVHAADQGSHTFSRFRSSFLYGNNNDDRFEFGVEDSGNTVAAFQGDDYVVAASGQTAGLGKGNDVYEIAGAGFHMITLGKGKDVVVLNAVEGVDFAIQDFDFTEDRLLLSDELDRSLLSVSLERTDDSNRWSSYLCFKYDGTTIGQASIQDTRSDGYTYFTDPMKMVELMFMNANSVDLSAFARTYFDSVTSMDPMAIMRDVVVNGELFMGDDTLVTHNDWRGMDAETRSGIIAEAMDDFGGNSDPVHWLAVMAEMGGDDPGDYNMNEFNFNMFSDMMDLHSGLRPTAEFS